MCITAFIKRLTGQLWCLSLRQAFNSQNHLNSHCRIQVLFIKLHCNFMNFNQHSCTCTQTHALKIPIFIFNLLNKTPKHKHLSIYSDDRHLKPTRLTVHYKHSSTSLVYSMKVPHWQTVITFCELVANSHIRAGAFAIKKNKAKPTRRDFNTVCIKELYRQTVGTKKIHSRTSHKFCYLHWQTRWASAIRYLSWWQLQDCLRACDPPFWHNSSYSFSDYAFKKIHLIHSEYFKGVSLCTLFLKYLVQTHLFLTTSLTYLCCFIFHPPNLSLLLVTSLQTHSYQPKQ